MRRFYTLFCLGCVALNLICGCSNTLSIDSEEVELTMVRLADGVEVSKPGPIILFEQSGAILAEYVNPKESDFDIFFFQDGVNHEQMLILIGNDNALFLPLDPSEDGHDNVALINSEEGFMNMYFGYFNSGTRTLSIKKTIPLGDVENTTKAAVNPGDEYRRIIKERLIDKIASNLSKWGDAIDLATLGYLPVREAISMMGMTVSCAGNTVLMDGAGTEFANDAWETVEDEVSDYVSDEVTNIFTKVAFKVKFKRAIMQEESQVAKHVAKRVRKTMFGKSPKIAEISDEESDGLTSSIFSRANVFRSIMSLRPGDYSKCPYKLSVSVTGVTKYYATFNGSVDFIGYGGTSAGPEAAVVEQGFVYKNYSTGEETYVISDKMKSQTVRLEPATKYAVWTYVSTFVGEWRSWHEDFYTKGTKLEVNPDYISCRLDGGEYELCVVVGTDATLKVLQHPSWCKMVPERLSPTVFSYNVSVSSSSIEREGNIVFETTTPLGETGTVSVPVTQIKELPWDNTSWVFTDQYNVWSSNGKWDIDIVSVDKGVYWSHTDWEHGADGSPAHGDGNQRDQVFTLLPGEDNTLILYKKLNVDLFTYHGYIIHEHIITRIDENRATMKWQKRDYENGILKAEETYTLPGIRTD